VGLGLTSDVNSRVITSASSITRWQSRLRLAYPSCIILSIVQGVETITSVPFNIIAWQLKCNCNVKQASTIAIFRQASWLKEGSVCSASTVRCRCIWLMEGQCSTKVTLSENAWCHFYSFPEKNCCKRAATTSKAQQGTTPRDGGGQSSNGSCQPWSYLKAKPVPKLLIDYYRLI